jgi:hypothetical protein
MLPIPGTVAPELRRKCLRSSADTSSCQAASTRPGRYQSGQATSSNAARLLFLGWGGFRRVETQSKPFHARREPEECDHSDRTTHIRGEVLTLDTVALDGRASTSSTILYFDGKIRESRGSECAGTQSSRRVDSRTVQILRECARGQVRLVRRAQKPGVLIREMSRQTLDGHRSERRFVLEKH